MGIGGGEKRMGIGESGWLRRDRSACTSCRKPTGSSEVAHKARGALSPVIIIIMKRGGTLTRSVPIKNINCINR